ncbi:hypothetical protein C8R44DRAFT_882050 [Mycena epipterygia]|nr:hypothetical protein C8R44DRAFT_882050 [Mycena epipterygia]
MISGRQRFVYKEWVRDPKGKLLEKPPPKGKRTENNIIWGHTLDDFYWISRIPGVNVLTIWSRSMIQEYGENYLKEKHDKEPQPRRLRPWPCLTLPGHIKSASELGHIDEDCGHHHERPLRRIQDEIAKTPKVATGSKTKAICGFIDVLPARRSQLNINTVTVKSVDCAASASVAASDISPTAHDVASATVEVAVPEATTPMDVDTPVAVSTPPSPLQDASSPADSMKTTSWTTDGAEWAAAKIALPPDAEPGASAEVAITSETAETGDFGAQATKVKDNKADAMVIDALTTEAALVDKPDVDAHVDVGGSEIKASTEKPLGNVASEHVLLGAQTDSSTAVPNVASRVDAKPEAGQDTSPVAVPSPIDDVATSKPATTTTTNAKKTTEVLPPGLPSVSSSPTPAPLPTPEPPKPIFHDLPKLEEFIPEEYFPDILYVNDPDDNTAIAHHYYGYSTKPTEKPQSQERVPRKYKRVWPRFARDTEPATAFNTDVACPSIKFPTPPAPSPPVASTSPRVVPGPETNLRIAHLNLSSSPRLGVGHHSVVHRAALRLPSPLGAHSPAGEVTVAAKMGFPGDEARQLLLNEGKIYDAFPKHLMEDWCGFNLVAPITHPVPVRAVVPKFYGYYVPVREDIEREKQESIRAWKEQWKEKKQKEKAKRAEARAAKKAEKDQKRKQAEGDGQDVDVTVSSGKAEDGASAVKVSEAVRKIEDSEEEESEDEDDGIDEDAVEQDGLERFMRSSSYKEWQRMSPILLLEECGSPIVPAKFTDDARSECYSQALRLHYADFTQGSFYERNILVQPGPLTVAPSARSDRTPSFRIIDFGRGEYWPYELEAAKTVNEKRRHKSKAQIRDMMQVPTEAEMKRRVAAEERYVLLEKETLEQCGTKWWESRDYEVRKAHSELKIRDFNY